LIITLIKAGMKAEYSKTLFYLLPCEQESYNRSRLRFYQGKENPMSEKYSIGCNIPMHRGGEQQITLTFVKLVYRIFMLAFRIGISQLVERVEGSRLPNRAVAQLRTPEEWWPLTDSI
jgi:hypothetical protein